MIDVVEGEAALREQVAQLQGALDSRVMVERAAGMLRERLGLPVKTAFELLRSSARSSRVRLTPLAEEVVASFATPAAVVRTLSRSPEVFRLMRREDRVLQTVEFFGEVNDLIAASAAGDNELSFLCECANP